MNGRELTVYEAIQCLTQAQGYPPTTVREVGQAVGLRSSSQVHGILCELRKRGLVKWEPERVRTLRVTG
jgi:repressor LexA